VITHQVAQRSVEWYALRAGLPTASAFSKLITSKGEESKSLSGYALTLAAEKFVGQPVEAWQGNEWTARGKDLEPRAISLYEFAHDVTVDPVGFVTDDARTMGCSPDGLVNDDGMIELKCLKAENHVQTILYFQKHHCCPTDYVQQTQGQLMICDRAWCDLVFYHPLLPLLVIRQKPDAVIQRALAKAVKVVGHERDAVLAALRAQQARGDAAPAPAAHIPVADFNQTAPVF
jgi:putative phage-type endonuclease